MGRGPVSNPLGWEGDRATAEENIVYEQVSNPLGWEGDLWFKVKGIEVK